MEDRHACKLQVTVFYADAKGKILGSAGRTIEGSLKEETYKRIMKTGISFSTTIPVMAKKQIIKVVVYDEQSDRVGSKLVRLP